MLLPTAIISLQTSTNYCQDARALCDTGAQGCLVTHELVSRLNLPISPSSAPVFGVGNVESTRAHGTVSLNFGSLYSTQPQFSVEALVVDVIAGQHPEIELPKFLFKEILNLELADPTFYKPGPIQVLLGADVCGRVFDGKKIEIRSNGLTALSSQIGYLVLGPVPDVCTPKPGPLAAISLAQIVEKFWKIEEPPESVSPITNPQYLECEKIFTTTTQRDDSGQFICRLPFLSTRPPIGCSKLNAEKRFYSLERRLKRDSEFRDKYIAFIREYIELKHMSPVTSDLTNTEHYYIPHHGVFKSSGDNPKIRVVFDGSSPSSNGVSLNQCLHSGPKLHCDITHILLNFRRHAVVFVTDVRMMFRMTWIHPDDRKYQLILWRESPSDPLVSFELNTNTYGLRSSPYISMRALRELAHQERDRFPLAAGVLENDFFVDDCLTGAPSLQQARELRAELELIMKAGGYELRKWISNEPELLDDLPKDHLQNPYLFSDPENPQTIAVLGVQYNPVNDMFTYKSSVSEESNVTKRTILSLIARTYDPCGWISPVVFKAKAFIQRLWLSGLGWDDPLTLDLKNEWMTFVCDLPNISRVAVPRQIFPSGTVSYSLHGFCDASTAGYAAVVYLRAEHYSGEAAVHLLMSKTKVAPTRTHITIPKLELLGATLLSKLILHVGLCLQKSIVWDSIHCWTDSQIALAWISTPPHNLQTFEANRVTQINASELPIVWHHIPGVYNPADCASRGLTASELVKHPLWWLPSWLTHHPELWPISVSKLPPDIPGLRCHLVQNTVSIPDPSFLLERYSSLDKLIGVVAVILRFLHNNKNRDCRRTNLPLSACERKEALIHVAKLVQSVAFIDVLKALHSSNPVRGALKRLSLFLDECGVIRVGGRLRHSDLPYETCHPILLPKDGFFVRLLVTHFHLKNSHAGPNTLHAILSREFWILSARRIIRNVIFKCLPCYRLNSQPIHPRMGDLPRDRITQARPFQGVGTDFAGPFYTKVQSFRNRRLIKSYLCVFVCLATKAVHLEIVSDLSTDAFVAALSRFVSRRGTPSLIRSDCGRNYVGADNYLTEVYQFLTQNQISIGHAMSKRSITWVFDPPASPHWGGLFEAAVKSAKSHLKRVIGETPLTFEELTTVFTKIEAVLNSRPLCPISYDDPSDLDILTPGHFIIGQPLTALPEFSYRDIKLNKLTRFQLIQQITQHFWRRWHSQYLSTLQSRQKWTDPTRPVEKGELVLIKEDNLHPLDWRRGRILEVYPGEDNVIRVVKVKTPTGVLTRSLSKLVRLPL